MLNGCRIWIMAVCAGVLTCWLVACDGEESTTQVTGTGAGSSTGSATTSSTSGGTGSGTSSGTVTGGTGGTSTCDHTCNVCRCECDGATVETGVDGACSELNYFECGAGGFGGAGGAPHYENCVEVGTECCDP